MFTCGYHSLFFSLSVSMFMCLRLCVCELECALSCVCGGQPYISTSGARDFYSFRQGLSLAQWLQLAGQRALRNLPDVTSMGFQASDTAYFLHIGFGMELRSWACKAKALQTEPSPNRTPVSLCDSHSNHMIKQDYLSISHINKSRSRVIHLFKVIERVQSPAVIPLAPCPADGSWGKGLTCHQSTSLRRDKCSQSSRNMGSSENISTAARGAGKAAGPG